MPRACAAASASAICGADVECAVERQPIVSHLLGERFAEHALHDDVGNALVGADVVNRQDIGMVQRRGGTRLPLQPLKTLRVGGEVRVADP